MDGSGGLSGPLSSRAARAGLGLALAVVVVGVIAVPGSHRLDRGRQRAAAAAVVAAPDRVAHALHPSPDAVPSDATGSFVYRPGTWLSVVTLAGLPQVAGRERVLVWLRSRDDWLLAGAVKPDRAGKAEVRFAAEPPPWRVVSLVVTLDPDDSTSHPHGEVLLRWTDPAYLAFLRSRGLPTNPPRD